MFSTCRAFRIDRNGMLLPLLLLVRFASDGHLKSDKRHTFKLKVLHFAITDSKQKRCVSCKEKTQQLSNCVINYQSEEEEAEPSSI